MKRLFSYMSKGRARQRGAALVELGILLIPMFILLMGLLESGRAFYQKGQLTKLTEASARYLSRGVDIVDESTCSINATEWNTVLGRATNLLQYGDVDSTGLAELLEGVSLSVTSTLQNGSGGVSACVISVSASMTYQSFFGSQGLLFYFDGIQLRANTQEVYVGA